MLGFQMAFDVTGDPEFPEKAAFEVARELGCARDHARRGVGRDERQRHPADARARVHDARRRSTSTPPPSTRTPTSGSPRPAGRRRSPPRASRRCGQGYPSSWALRQHGIPISLSMDTSVWWSADCSPRCAPTLSADRAREHLEAHADGRDRHQHHAAGRATSSSGPPAAAPRALGLDAIDRQPRAGQAGRRRADQERRLAGHVPDPQPLRPRRLPGPARRRRHGAGQRRVVKHDHRLVGIDLARPARRSATPSTTCAGCSARRPGWRG